MKRASGCVANEKEVGKLRTLLTKCLAVLESEELQGVMVMSSVHGAPYSGPQVDLGAVRELLEKGSE